jgi:nucleotide-binding universal stress UspA family protein
MKVKIKRRREDMFQRILVPLDGSVRAARAIPVAARMAETSGGKVVLVSVVNHFNLGKDSIPGSEQMQEEGEVSVDAANLYLQEIARTSELAAVAVETAVLSGPIVSILLRATHMYNSDIIVLSSHGHTGVTGKLLGNVAEKVVSRASVPVLLLRDDEALPLKLYSRLERPFRVLVAVNGTSFSNMAIAPAAELAITLSPSVPAVLHLTRVVLPEAMIHQRHIYGPQAVTIEQARQSLRAMATYLYEGPLAPDVAQNRLYVTWSAVESEQVPDALVRMAEYGDTTDGLDAFGGCDVIAMSTHGLEDLQHLPSGGVVASVIALTKRPVLFVH